MPKKLPFSNVASRSVLLAVVLGLQVAIPRAHGGLTYTTLVSFDGTNGSTPMGTLLQAVDGNFYGVTQSGGAAGAGTLFKFSLDGTLTTLVSFPNTNGGFEVHAGLVQDADGNFYGTSIAGGAYGQGTLFRITPEGVFTILVSFDGTNGAQPMA